MRPAGARTDPIPAAGPVATGQPRQRSGLGAGSQLLNTRDRIQKLQHFANARMALSTDEQIEFVVRDDGPALARLFTLPVSARLTLSRRCEGSRRSTPPG